MRKFLKKILKLFFGNYEIYWIFKKELNSSLKAVILPEKVLCNTLSAAELASSMSLFANQKNYLGDQSVGYGLYVNNVLVSVCFYWFGERYKQRNFIDLPESAAKLVQITTDPDKQGKGYAALLLSKSVADMRQRGFTTLFARIWHNNHPSISIFKKNKWIRVKLKIRIFPFGRSLSFSLPF